MKLAVFVSDYRNTVDTLERLNAEKLGIILVSNGVYHGTITAKGSPSPVLNKSAKFYALSEDLDTRGLKSANIDSKIQIINYSELVDLIFNDYEKLAWL